MPRYAKLRKLLDVRGGEGVTEQQLEQAAGRVADALKKDRAGGRFRVVMLSRGRQTINIDYGSGDAAISRNTAGEADFEVRGSSETLAEIVAGRLSPVDAYLTGQLEVHGDLERGKRIYARVAARGRRDL